MSQFNQSTDRWFDRLADYAENRQSPALQALLYNAKCHPTQRNLKAVRNFAGCLRPKVLRRYLLRTINEVADHEFKSEFRFTYHTYPKSSGQVSACGELFSLIRQAIEYHTYA
jgi:GT2 family glycosyltransferase